MIADLLAALKDDRSDKERKIRGSLLGQKQKPIISKHNSDVSVNLIHPEINSYFMSQNNIKTYNDI